MRWLLSLAVWSGIVAGLTARRQSMVDPVLDAWWAERDRLRAIREAGGA